LFLCFAGHCPLKIRGKHKILRQIDGTTRAKNGTAVPHRATNSTNLQSVGTARAKYGTAVPVKMSKIPHLFDPVHKIVSFLLPLPLFFVFLESLWTMLLPSVGGPNKVSRVVVFPNSLELYSFVLFNCERHD